MDSYLSAWKVFRRLSDENETTARHLIRCSTWPAHERVIIGDLGCGDGRLVETIIVRSTVRAAEVRLLDPDAELLREAQQCIVETGLVDKVTTVLGTAEEAVPSRVADCNAVLLVHVVYLMPNGTLKRLLADCPPGVPFFIILDEPRSVFTELWERTAPKYHDRAKRAHDVIRNLPRSDYRVNETRFHSRIGNPFQLPRADVRRAILSILCYADVASDPESELFAWVKDVLDRHAATGDLRCESVCYEVERVSQPPGIVG